MAKSCLLVYKLDTSKLTTPIFGHGYLFRGSGSLLAETGVEPFSAEGHFCWAALQVCLHCVGSEQAGLHGAGDHGTRTDRTA